MAGTVVLPKSIPTGAGRLRTAATWRRTGARRLRTAANVFCALGGATECVCGPRRGRTCISGTCSSDVRLKKDIQSLVGSLDTLTKLRPVTFEWKDPARGEGTKAGFIAQEVEEVKPDWVAVDDQGFKTINMDRLPVMLVDSVRTLKLQNDLLAERVRELESGRRPLASGIDLNGVGFGIGGLAIGVGLVLVARRKRFDERAIS
jgi:hypothetical protein